MAYDPLMMRKCGGTSGQVSIEDFCYDTADDKATVVAAGYINDAVDKGMSVGDRVMVRVWPAVPNASKNGQARTMAIRADKGESVIYHNDAAPTAVFYGIVTVIDDDRDSATYQEATVGLTLDFA